MIVSRSSFKHRDYDCLETEFLSSNENFLERLSETTKSKLLEKRHHQENFVFSQTEIQEIKDAIEKLKITFFSHSYTDNELDLSDYYLILGED